MSFNFPTNQNPIFNDITNIIPSEKQLSKPENPITNVGISIIQEPQKNTTTAKATLPRNISLLSAISRGDLLQIQALLEQNINLNPINSRGNTALMVAILGGHTDIAKLLIEKGAKLNEQNIEENTALMLAIIEGHTDIAQLLIEKGAAVNCEDFEGTTTLMFAISEGHIDIAKLLIAAGAKNQNSNGDTALMVAITKKQDEISKILIEQGEGLNLKDCCESTALILALLHGRLEIAELLISKDVELNSQDFDENTALLLAISEGYPSIAKQLIDKGVFLDSQDFNGETALALAIEKGHLSIAKYLIEKGANPNILNINGDSPLMLAANDGYAELSEMLIKHGAEPDVINKDSQCFISEARQKLLFSKEYLSKFPANYELMKEETRTKGLGHSFKISGKSTVVDQSGHVSAIDLEAGQSPFWYRKMFKATELLAARYPDLIPTSLKDSLCKLLKNASQIVHKSPEDLLKSIQNNDFTVLPANFKGHDAQVLVWNHYFIICNRGTASRHPVEVYTFDKNKLDLTTLQEIINSSRTKSEFKELFFKKLPAVLNFQSDAFTEALKKACLLPDQEVGNCTWESPETLVWVFMQLEKIFEDIPHLVQKELSSIPKDFDKKSIEAQKLFNNWLLLNQLYHMERYVGLRLLRDPDRRKEKLQSYNYTVKESLLRKAFEELVIPEDTDTILKQAFHKLYTTIFPSSCFLTTKKTINPNDVET